MDSTPSYQTQQASQGGFTLIELSIVLVIIGLIVGGILVGQDMIKAAEIRATISQIEKYNTATNTFRGKYNYIPGDIPASVATSFGIFAETTGSPNTAGHQDGNGLLEGGAAAAVKGLGETLEFWRHLSDAELVDGRFGVTGNSAIGTAGALTGTVTAGTMANSFPSARIGRGNYIVTFSVTGQNFYQIFGITSVATDGTYTSSSQLTPVESQNIDTKVDDGLPNSGAVRARGGTADPNGTADAACLNGAAYNIGTTPGTTPACQIRLRFN
jgi:prepilin-type N-terminal cleavage/methylation domain-containing protein